MVRRVALAAVILAACTHPAHGPRPLGNSSPTTGAGAGAGTLGTGPLTAASTIELVDTWVGLGCTHEFHALLSADGAGWSGQGTLKVGWDHDEPMTRQVAVRREAVVALEQAAVAARAALAAEQAPTGERDIGWTDDYPSGSMTFTTPSGTRKLAFTDQWRVLQWEEGGATAMLDRPHDLFDDSATTSQVWTTYYDVLIAAGMPAWIEEACRRP